MTTQPKPPPPTTGPKKVAEPWPKVPRTLPERVALLKQRCPGLACTKQVATTQERYLSLKDDEPEAHKGCVVACLEQCRTTSQ